MVLCRGLSWLGPWVLGLDRTMPFTWWCHIEARIYSNYQGNIVIPVSNSTQKEVWVSNFGSVIVTA